MKRAFKFGQIQLRAAVICSILASSHKERGSPGRGGGKGDYNILLLLLLLIHLLLQIMKPTRSQ